MQKTYILFTTADFLSRYFYKHRKYGINIFYLVLKKY